MIRVILMKLRQFLFLEIAILGLLVAFTANGKEKEGHSQSEAIKALPLAASNTIELDQKIKSMVDERVGQATLAELKVLQSRMQSVEIQTNRAEDHVSEQVVLIVHLMEGFLAFITLIAVFAGIEVWRVKTIKEDIEKIKKTLEKDYEEISKKANDISVKAEEAKCATDNTLAASQQVHAMKEGLQKAWGNVNQVLNGIKGQTPVTLASDSIEQPPEKLITLSDQDLLLVFCAQLNLIKEEESSEHFIRFAGYWRDAGDYARATVRAKQADQLTPNNPRVYASLSSISAYWANSCTNNPALRLQKLADALSYVDKALEIYANEGISSGPYYVTALHNKGWILDEQAKFDEAVEWYKKARELDKEEAKLSNSTPDYILTYNLLCSMTKCGLLDEALKELDAIINKQGIADLAIRDDELESLRLHPRWPEIVNKAPPSSIK